MDFLWKVTGDRLRYIVHEINRKLAKKKKEKKEVRMQFGFDSAYQEFV